MLKIAAVDDEINSLERFERIANKVEDIYICGLFETGKQLLSYIKETTLDAVFIDIEMPDINGFQLSEQILDVDENINIVFVSAFNQYASEAFEAQAVDYILKPICEDRFIKTLKRLRKNINLKPIQKPYIQCFGGFEVFINDVASVWKNSKAKEMLAFLIHKDGVPAGWEQIASEIWPEFNTEKAQANFHATTYLLRKRLSELGISNIIENGRGCYRIIKEQVDCELYEVQEIVKKGPTKKDDFYLIDKLSKNDYMNSTGYIWSFPKAAELYETSLKLMEVNREN